MTDTWTIEEAFGIENLRRSDRDLPAPGPGEVRVAFRAWSLNYRDYLVVTGAYNPKQKLPLVPLSDAVGVVEEVGPSVSRVAVGDRVCPSFAQAWIEGPLTQTVQTSTLGSPIDGVATRKRIVPAAGLVKVPVHLSDREASTLPCAGVTAWNALFELGDVGPGDTVLVQGTGGVSILALQLATMVGARVIVTSSSEAKLERARALGAWRTINYREDESWGRSARSMTVQGVDHVIEVGGAGTIEQSLAAVKAGGTLSIIGILDGAGGSFPLTRVLMNAVRMQGVLVGSRGMLERLCRAIEANDLRPAIDGRSFRFDELPAALEHMKAGAHFGKITLGDG